MRPQDAKAHRLRTVTRLVSVIEWVRRGRPVYVWELAHRHDCSERTIRRDIEAIEAAGIRPRVRAQ